MLYFLENIIFGKAYNKEHHDKGLHQVSSYDLTQLKVTTVIYQCDLEHNLTLFDTGDETKVGEKGLTLRYA